MNYLSPLPTCLASNYARYSTNINIPFSEQIMHDCGQYSKVLIVILVDLLLKYTWCVWVCVLSEISQPSELHKVDRTRRARERIHRRRWW